MTSCSSISTLEIRKEGTSRFYLCIEWTSTFTCFYYMVLTLMELGSHSSCNDHKHHSWNHGWPWSGYCPDVVVTSKVLRLKCLSFIRLFIDFFLLLSTTLLALQLQIHVCISKFQYNYRSPNFYICHHLKTSKLKDYPQSFTFLDFLISKLSRF